jgi:hypothetical protein
MSACDFCNKEPKFIFICPHCEKRFCKTHRRPKDHDCILLKPISFQDTSAKAIETSKIETSLIETENTFFVDAPDDFNKVEKPADLEIIHDNNKEESKSSTLFTIFNSKRKISVIVLIIVSILSAFSTGTLINQNDYNNKLQQRYDALYEYYLETQQRNVALTEELNKMTIEMISIQDKLYQLSSDYDLVITLLDKLQEDYNQLLEDYSSLQAE